MDEAQDIARLRTDVTTLLAAVGGGDRQAAAQLLPLVYGELRKLAVSRMAKLPPGQTLQPTALVHEAYMRLVGDADPGWQNRGHFFGAAAQAMRDILVEHARRKGRHKHGGGLRRIEMSDSTPQSPTDSTDFGLPADQILAIDDAMARFSEEHPRQADVVMYRYFGGLPIELVAEIMGVSSRTVERDWRFARAWLHRAISDTSSANAPDAID
jgi:RNA polymerase sigma factor (TIGR02999 family)